MTSPLARRVLSGERNAVARAIRLLDDREPAGAEVLRELWSAAAGARVVGVTGPPGAGKSTLVDCLIEAFRARGERVGVAAVDPSSPFTGGAILGDRIRMQRHAADDGVFIRSLATRGHLGGLSASTLDVLAVLAAAGFRTLILETVGVGQDEVEVNRVADSVLLVVAPGAGDAVQTLKAGVMEIAHVFAVNKADQPGADQVARDIEQLLAYREHGPGRADPGAAAGWIPPVVSSVAVEGRGIPELLEALDRHAGWLRSSGEERRRHRERARVAIVEQLRGRLDDALDARLPGRLDEAAARVADGASDPHAEAEALWAELSS
ncbi:MAG: methylmalonyl Co-A mutase-associated GTPase MeaB [Deltaproteobacteria bacterium]|nr:methylmalonyl Co-A mutase-associated GTPase MeaB [Deltaproteobacteria bacterium]